MLFIEFVARFAYKIRPLLLKLPNWCAVNISTIGRNFFAKSISKYVPSKCYFDTDEFNVRVWDITFKVPIFNSAGMFKNGMGYYFVAKQGSGAFLAGTTTSLSRRGNKKANIRCPLVFFPFSNSAINWMGLPNESHFVVAKRLSDIAKLPKCPIGASLSFAPELPFTQDLMGMLNGLKAYEKANVDFIEINESCPNLVHQERNILINNVDKDLINRLEFISKKFLAQRNRNLPVIVKFSVDVNPELVSLLIDLLIDLKFDGVNFGNTSTDYAYVAERLENNEELKLFEYFIHNFGGGVSGAPIKDKSLNLIKVANEYIRDKRLSREFHIIRTGGISNREDIDITQSYGSKLMQWYTGYFRNFADSGFNVYRELFCCSNNELP